MDKKATIKASKLILDYGIYPRHEIDTYHVREMLESLRAGKSLPPVLVDKASLRVVDGFHRVSAFMKFEGPDAKVPCVMREYASEKEMFTEAITLNASHGRTLTVYDKVRCLSVGLEMGLKRENLAEVLNLTIERAEGLLEYRVAAKGEPLKYTMRHLAGEKLTAGQASYNKDKAGGLDQLFYINQVINLLESGSVDWGRATVVAALKRLDSLLEQALEKVTA